MNGVDLGTKAVCYASPDPNPVRLTEECVKRFIYMYFLVE